MPGPNVLDLVGDIREAVERLPKDQLVDILVYVFKEYVVEGSPPLAAGPTAAEDDLAGMSFGEVVRSLQLRLDLPELELFDVQGERVSVRLQGRAIPIEISAARAEPGPPPPPPVAPAPTPPPAAVAPAPVAAAPRPPVHAPMPTPAASPARPSPAASQQPAPAASQQSGGASSSSAPASPAAPQQGAPSGGGRGGLLEID